METVRKINKKELDRDTQCVYSPFMKNQLTNKLSLLSFDQIAEIASLMFHDTRDEAGMVLVAALEVLESKMSSDDFVRFCDKLAA